MIRCVIANTGRECQFWLIFKIELLQHNYQVIIYYYSILKPLYFILIFFDLISFFISWIMKRHVTTVI